MPTARSFTSPLTTARFHLRRYRSADAPAVPGLVERNRERLVRSFPELAQRPRTAEEASAYVAAIERQWREGAGFVYGIWSAHDGTLIGQLRVKNIDWSVPSAELSYFVDGEWLRRGVATEAIRAVLREAFETGGFKRIYVRVIAANEESLALARRLGLQHEGIQRNAFRCGLGELHDLHLFAMTDADYRLAQLSSTIDQGLRPRSDTMFPIDIAKHPVHLGRGATAVVEPAFAGGFEWYQEYVTRHAADGAEGRLVSMFSFTAPWEMWEMHPSGSEVVLCTSGTMTLHQEAVDGTRRTISLRPGEYAINEPGTWHTADVAAPATAVFITAGLGTQHRPR